MYASPHEMTTTHSRIKQDDNLTVTKNIKLCLARLADGWSTSGAQEVSAH